MSRLRFFVSKDSVDNVVRHVFGLGMFCDCMVTVEILFQNSFRGSLERNCWIFLFQILERKQIPSILCSAYVDRCSSETLVHIGTTLIIFTDIHTLY
jgi:hypothetical protein